MKIKYEKGDLLDTNCQYIAHCVNAQGVMGSGVAKAIKQVYPRAYDIYMQKYITDRLHLGQIIQCDFDSKTILHIVGQKYYGYDGLKYVDYDALQQAFQTINYITKQPVAFPKLGAGLAGGDWDIISQLLQKRSRNYQPIVYQL